MNRSTRTLQRQLTGRGTTFNNVLDQMRERLCESYLADATLKLTDVAHMLGYADQTAFSPARWRKSQAERERI